MTTQTHAQRSALAGIGLMVLGIFLFCCNDALGKWLLGTYSVWQMLAIRSIAAMLLLSPFVWREGVAGFRFVGLPAATTPPQDWLDGSVEAEVVGARAAVLGPEPVIGAQRIVLRLEDQRLVLMTDGLGPFVLAEEPQ